MCSGAMSRHLTSRTEESEVQSNSGDVEQSSAEWSEEKVKRSTVMYCKEKQTSSADSVDLGFVSDISPTQYLWIHPCFVGMCNTTTTHLKKPPFTEETYVRSKVVAA